MLSAQCKSPTHSLSAKCEEIHIFPGSGSSTANRQLLLDKQHHGSFVRVMRFVSTKSVGARPLVEIMNDKGRYRARSDRAHNAAFGRFVCVWTSVRSRRRGTKGAVWFAIEVIEGACLRSCPDAQEQRSTLFLLPLSSLFHLYICSVSL
jgi:hypothetical protein